MTVFRLILTCTCLAAIVTLATGTPILTSLVIVCLVFIVALAF